MLDDHRNQLQNINLRLSSAIGVFWHVNCLSFLSKRAAHGGPPKSEYQEGVLAMLLRRINPTFPVNELRREVGRLFEDFMGPTNGGFNRVGAFPPINVWEDTDAVFAEAEVPGLTMNELEVTVVGNELSIKGDRKPCGAQGFTFHRQERGVGEFARFVTLPVPVDASRVQATLKNGVLTITLPKAEAARPRRIEVRGQ